MGFASLLLVAGALSACGTAARSAPPATPAPSAPARADVSVEGALDIVAAAGAPDAYFLVDSAGRRYVLEDPGGLIGTLGPQARAPGTRVVVVGALRPAADGRRVLRVVTVRRAP